MARVRAGTSRPFMLGLRETAPALSLRVPPAILARIPQAAGRCVRAVCADMLLCCMSGCVCRTCCCVASLGPCRPKGGNPPQVRHTTAQATQQQVRTPRAYTVRLSLRPRWPPGANGASTGMLRGQSAQGCTPAMRHARPALRPSCARSSSGYRRPVSRGSRRQPSGVCVCGVCGPAAVMHAWVVCPGLLLCCIPWALQAQGRQPAASTYTHPRRHPTACTHTPHTHTPSVLACVRAGLLAAQ